MKPAANFDVIRIFSTTQGPIVHAHGAYRKPHTIAVDAVFQATDPVDFVETAAAHAPEVDPPKERELLAPIQSQEVWAAGVTYLRSRAARMEESRDAGGGNFYDRVYDAERPELFFKATPARVAARERPCASGAIRDGTSPNRS
jgi:2-dehydro-3-deoxy-D-arabinonate dehydratase